MNKSLGLVSILTDGPYLTELRYGIDEAIIASQYSHNGYKVSLYSGKNMAKMSDLARQLARMRVDMLIFQVCNISVSTAFRLISIYKKICPQTEVIFWSKERIEVDNTSIQIRYVDQPEQLIKVLSDNNQISASVYEYVSPYLCQLLRAEDALRLGINAQVDEEQLEQELQYLSEILDGQNTLLLRFDTCLKRAITIYSNLLEKYRACLSFDAVVMNSQLDSNTIVEIDKSVIKKLQLINLNKNLQLNSTDIEAVNSAHETIKKTRQYGNNGVRALLSGIYPDAINSIGINHIKFSNSLSAEKKREILRWSEGDMLLRSASVCCLSGENNISDMNAINLELKELNNCWPKHNYILNQHKSTVKLLFDDKEEALSQCMALSYSQLNNNIAVHHNPQGIFVEINSENDISLFKQDLHALHNDGIIRILDKKNTINFVNSCRWVRNGGCRVEMLRRVEITDTNNIKLCKDAGEVGKLGEALDKVAIRVKQDKQLESGRRECATCAVRDECSHCTYMPETISSHYCSVRKQYPQTSLFLELNSIFPYLAGTISASEAKDLPPIKLSYHDLPNIFYNGAGESNKTADRPVIINIGQRYIAWWRGTPKFMSLSAPLVNMMEAWWCGANAEQAIEDLYKNFSVEKNIAYQSFIEGMAKLKQGGIICG